MATGFHQVQLSAEQWEFLTEVSVRTGKPPEAILSDALQSLAHGQTSQGENGEPSKSVYESLLEAGFIGCIADGPPDLSTNPKYMEGFGESDH